MTEAAKDPDRLLKIICSMGSAAIFSVGQAATILRMRDSAAREWLNRRNLVVTVNGRRMVRWRDVEEEIARNGEPEAPPPRPRPRRLARKSFGSEAK